jgi:hypothetical protein
MAGKIGNTGGIISNNLIFNIDAGKKDSYTKPGTQWSDITDYKNNGTLTGATFSSSNGGTIEFDGVNDNVVIPNNAVLNVTSNFTVCCWVNVLSLPRTYLGVVDKFDGINSTGYAIDIPNGGGGMPTKFRFTVGQGGSYKSAIASSSINLGQWYYVCGLYDGSFIRIYINGTLETSTACTGNISTTTENLVLGGDNASTLYSNIRIASLQIYNTNLSITQLMQNYTSTLPRFVSKGIDSDSQNFLTAALINDAQIANAVNNLVLDLKKYGLWSKMKAIYPVVGGNAWSHKFNLKDPRDDNSAYRLLFTNASGGNWVHSSTGMTPNGTSDFADTYLNSSTKLILNDTHLSFYSRSNVPGGVHVEIGNYNGTSVINLRPTVAFAIGGPSSASYNATTNSTGFWLTSRTSNIVLKGYRNGILDATSTSLMNSSYANLNLLISARNESGTPLYFSTKQCAFASIGDGLTDTEAANFYTIVQNYQTALGRQV